MSNTFYCNGRFGMKNSIALISLIVLISWFADAIGQEERVSTATRTEATTRLAVPAQPGTPGSITAKPGVLASAACCLKQCPGGGTCGTGCDVVDSLSACSSNIKFECPANKGLTCVGSSCSCE
jgi:hypothetical protein